LRSAGDYDDSIGFFKDSRRPAAASTSKPHLSKGDIMLYYAAVFLVIALIAALFGFGGIVVGAVEIAKVLFFIFVVMTIVTFIMGMARRGKS
jgi:uncharacterized membrane protein YtjA (UPF0391 family)